MSIEDDQDLVGNMEEDRDRAEHIARVVDAGAQWLDAERPGWWRHVDTARLNVASAIYCPLAQAFGSRYWGNALDYVSAQTGLDRDGSQLYDWLGTHGFAGFAGATVYEIAPWGLLNEQWRVAVQDRRRSDIPS